MVSSFWQWFRPARQVCAARTAHGAIEAGPASLKEKLAGITGNRNVGMRLLKNKSLRPRFA